MRHFEFSREVLAEIERDRFRHPDPLVQRRMEVLWLKAHGETHVRIVELARDLIRLSGLPEHSIEIVFSGIRPGEKLYEELYFADEETLPTTHPKVRVTPHVAGPTNPRTAAASVADNVRRLRAGQPLVNLIDRAAGY